MLLSWCGVAAAERARRRQRQLLRRANSAWQWATHRRHHRDIFTTAYKHVATYARPPPRPPFHADCAMFRSCNRHLCALAHRCAVAVILCRTRSDQLRRRRPVDGRVRQRLAGGAGAHGASPDPCARSGRRRPVRVGCLVVRLPFGRAGRGRASFACRILYPHTRAHVNVPASPLLVSPQAALWRVMCVCDPTWHPGSASRWWLRHSSLAAPSSASHCRCSSGRSASRPSSVRSCACARGPGQRRCRCTTTCSVVQ